MQRSFFVLPDVAASLPRDENLTQVTSAMKPGQCMMWFCFGKENNSSRRVILKIELEINNLNSILSRSAVTPVFPHGERECMYECVLVLLGSRNPKCCSQCFVPKYRKMLNTCIHIISRLSRLALCLPLVFLSVAHTLPSPVPPSPSLSFTQSLAFSLVLSHWYCELQCCEQPWLTNTFTGSSESR